MQAKSERRNRKASIKKQIFAPVKDEPDSHVISINVQNRSLLDHLFNSRSGEELMQQLLSMFQSVHPILIAASLGHVVGLKKLIRVTADNINDIRHPKDCCTALHMAAKYGFPEATKFLLDSGASSMSHDNEGNTPFMAAIAAGHASVVNVLWQEKKRFSINHSNHEGQTAIHLAAAQGWESCVNTLITGGAFKNWVANDGRTALMIAAERGDSKTTKRLAENDANVLLEDKDVCSAICLAIKKDHSELAKYLLEKLHKNLKEEYVKRRIILLTVLPSVDETHQFFEDTLYKVFHALGQNVEYKNLLHKHKLLPSWIRTVYTHVAKESVTSKALLYIAEIMCLGTSTDVDGRFIEQFLRSGGPDLMLYIISIYRESGTGEMVAWAIVPLLPLAETTAGKKWLEQEYYKISESVDIFLINKDDLEYSSNMKDIIDALCMKFVKLYAKVQTVQAELHGAELLAEEEEEKEREQARRVRRREKKRQKRLQARPNSPEDTYCNMPDETTRSNTDDSFRIDNEDHKNPHLRNDLEICPDHTDKTKNEAFCPSWPVPQNSTAQKFQETPIVEKSKGSYVGPFSFTPEFSPSDKPFETVLGKKTVRELKRKRQQEENINNVQVPVLQPPDKQTCLKKQSEVRAQKQTRKKDRKKRTKSGKSTVFKLTTISESIANVEPFIQNNDGKENTSKSTRPETPENWDDEDGKEPHSNNEVTFTDENNNSSATIPKIALQSKDSFDELNPRDKMANLSVSLENMFTVTSFSGDEDKDNLNVRRHRRSKSDPSTIQLILSSAGGDAGQSRATSFSPSKLKSRLLHGLGISSTEQAAENTGKQFQACDTSEGSETHIKENSSSISDGTAGEHKSRVMDNSLTNDLLQVKGRRKRSRRGQTLSLREFLDTNKDMKPPSLLLNFRKHKRSTTQPERIMDREIKNTVGIAEWSDDKGNAGSHNHVNQLKIATYSEVIQDSHTVKYINNGNQNTTLQQHLKILRKHTVTTDQKTEQIECLGLKEEDKFSEKNIRKMSGHEKERQINNVNSSNTCLNEDWKHISDSNCAWVHRTTHPESDNREFHLTQNVSVDNEVDRCLKILEDSNEYHLNKVIHDANFDKEIHCSGSNSETTKESNPGKTIPKLNELILSPKYFDEKAKITIPNVTDGTTVLHLLDSKSVDGSLLKQHVADIPPMLTCEELESIVFATKLPGHSKTIPPPPGFPPLLKGESVVQSATSHKVKSQKRVTFKEQDEHFHFIPEDYTIDNFQSDDHEPSKMERNTEYRCSASDVQRNENKNKCQEKFDWNVSNTSNTTPIMNLETLCLPEPVAVEFAHLTPDPDPLYDNDPDKGAYIFGHIKRSWIGRGYFGHTDPLTELIHAQRDQVRKYNKEPIYGFDPRPKLTDLQQRLQLQLPWTCTCGAGDSNQALQGKGEHSIQIETKRIRETKLPEEFLGDRYSAQKAHYWLPSKLLEDDESDAAQYKQLVG